MWTDAFSRGPCTVTVTYIAGAAGQSELFSQVMAPGDSEPILSETFTNLVVSVSEGGLVSLDGDLPDIASWPANEDFYLMLRVIPGYAIGDQVRVRSLASAQFARDFNAYHAFTDFNDPSEVELTDEGDFGEVILSPDPADLSALAGRSEITVAAEWVNAAI